MRNDEQHNPHIPYDLKIQPYHKVVAKLTHKYCTSKEPLILDIGCGTGHTLYEIRKLIPNARLMAVDIDERCLTITQQRVSVEKSIHIEEIDEIFGLHQKYDVIILSHVLEHLCRPVDTIRATMNLLSPDGTLILAVPNPVRLQVILFNLMRIHYVNKGHVVSWDRSHFINLLETILSLHVICYAGDYFRLPFSHRITIIRPLEIFLAKIFPWFSFSHIAVIRK